MTKEEFIAIYCENSDMRRETYDEHFVALPCRCGEGKCKGWVTISNNPDAIAVWNDLYGEDDDVRP